ncbi:MAG: ABC transporter substrate-binding protein [Nakamurella sp.]
MRGKRSGAFTALLTVLTVGLVGCSAGSTSTPSTSTSSPSTAASGSATDGGTSSGPPTSQASTSAPAGDGTMAIGFVLEPISLDFTQTDGAAITQALLLNVYETLVKQDQDGQIVPLLAKSFTASPDGLTYTFQLRPDVMFSDGSPFTAEDAVFSIDRVKSDWKPSVKAGMDVVSSATATSPTELTVVLSAPSRSWLFNMTTRIGAMFSRTGVADLANTPIGTGPYTLQAWNKGDSIVMERNTTYWGDPAPIKTMTLKYFADPNAMNNALLTGGIQVVSTVQTPEALSQFSDTAKYQVIDGSTTGEVLLSMNDRTPALADLRVRQAISYALDRKTILDAAWSGYGTLIGTHEAPTDPWFADVDKYPYDPEKAKALLAEAGQSDLTLRLALPPVGYAAAAAPIVISQLAAVGITVQDSDVDFATWIKSVFTDHDFDLTIINHVEPRDAPTLFGNPDYYIGYDNAAVRDLFAQADRATTDAAANTDYQQALDQIATDAPVVWLWSFPNLIVADAQVQGIVANQISAAFELATISQS